MNFNYKAYEKPTGKMYIYFGFNSLEEEIYVSSLSDDKFRDGVVETIRSVTKDLNDFHILQSTGIEDIDGKEIYEGDIVKLTVPDRHYTMQGDGYSDIMREDGFEFVGEVKFLHAMWFIVDGGKGYPLIFDTDQTLEVIGNIYEHKHLLEENENENK